MTSPINTRKLAIALAGAALAAGAAAPSALAQQDLRSPDARDASAGAVQDLRSPDTRDASVGTVQDLRSPDARDAATGITPTVVVSAPVGGPDPVTTSVDGGFDWASAAIGVAVAGGLVLLLLFGFRTYGRHHGGTLPV